MEGTDLSDFKVFLVLHVQGFFFLSGYHSLDLQTCLIFH